MERREVIELFAKVRDGAPAITGPGANSGTLWSTDHQPATIYNMELGYPTAMCLGIALAAPAQRVFAIEGDGSMIAGLATLTSVGRHRPPNLVVLVLDNGIYATGVGHGPGVTEATAASHGTDLAGVAVSCGIPAGNVLDVDSPAATETALRRAVSEPGPWVIIARIDTSDATGSPTRRRPAVDIVESAGDFKREMVRRGFGAPPIG
jgi:thiamine pyrophosphate-dependent acetolactate synthase large subunit-like protein